MRFWCSASFLAPTRLVEVAQACEEIGFTGVMLGDHLACPATLRSTYPYSEDGSPGWPPSTPFPDPWVAIGAMAAVTETLRFGTNVFVAPARHPLVVAKAVATAATLAGGRVALGAGVGWMREEYEAAGQDFTTRGRRLDEMIDVLRALWTGDPVEHHGRFYDLDAVQISPVPADPIPVYIGGESDASLRRAARSDGWIGSVYDLDEARHHLGRLRKARRRQGSADRDGFEVIVAVPGRVGDLDTYRRLEDAGVTGVTCAPWMSRDGRDPRSGLDAFAERVMAKV